MTTYRSRERVPSLVRAAEAVAERLRFERSCAKETGRLLHVLVGALNAGTVGEIGTGCGVGAAWMVTALRPGVTFVSVDADSERVAAARELIRGYPGASILQGDWHDLLERGPFDLLFVDARPAKVDDPGPVVDAMRPGGLIVMDDLTPESLWPPEWQGKEDPVRTFWLNHERLAATEVAVTDRMQIILATKLA